MWILKSFLGIFSSKVAVNNFIDSCECSYFKHKTLFPNYDPHFYLAQAWLAYIQSRGQDIDNPGIKEAAFSTTFLMACIPEPICARALGIFLAYRERAEIVESQSQLQDEFNTLIAPVLAAREEGTLERLYKKYNSNMEYTEYDNFEEDDLEL